MKSLKIFELEKEVGRLREENQRLKYKLLKTLLRFRKLKTLAHE